MESLLELREVSVGDYLETLMNGVNWRIKKGEQWVVFGINGSGKTLLSDFLLRRLGLVKGSFFQKEGLSVGGFGFEQQQEIIARERYLDESEFMDSEDPGTSVRRWVREASIDRTADYDIEAIALKLDCLGILDRGLRYLSAGELRKAALLMILGSSAQVLIFDEPYEGLDVKSRGELRGLFRDLVAQGRTLLLFCQRDYEIPDFVTHGLVVNDRNLSWSGDIEGAQIHFAVLVKEEPSLKWNQELLGQLFPDPKGISPVPLIEMRDVTVKYNDFVVFKDLNWTVAPGEHWLILGPNGSGKSTLLNLIFGENNQVFKNEVRLWGQRRGSGESLWDLRQKMGFLSYAFHLQHQFLSSYTLREILISGFYDSVGLYRQPGWVEEQKARLWLQLLGFEHPEDSFNTLSFGSQRLLLIARALVKGPELLILDEPCQGMDQKQRTTILNFVDFFVQYTGTQLLYVTHNPEERLSCLNRELKLPWQA